LADATLVADSPVNHLSGPVHTSRYLCLCQDLPGRYPDVWKAAFAGGNSTLVEIYIGRLGSAIFQTGGRFSLTNLSYQLSPTPQVLFALYGHFVRVRLKGVPDTRSRSQPRAGT